MIPVPSGVRVWLAVGHTDMRRGMNRLADETRRLWLFPAIIKRNPDPKGTLGAGSAGLAVGGAYLAVATGADHLVDEFGVACQDEPVDRTGRDDDLAVATQ